MKLNTLVQKQYEILEKVCVNQEIERLVVYDTRTPLAESGVDLGGSTIPQDDIEGDIYGETKRVYLYPNNEINNELKTTIVIRRENCTLIEEQIGSIKIDIICPILYSMVTIENINTNRESEIGDRIIALVNTVNGVVVTNSHESILEDNKEYNVLTLDLLYTDNLQTVPLA